MLHHYLKIASRNLSRNRLFSIINTAGLAVGMGVCIIIFQYIHFESSFDRFHTNAEHLYRLTTISSKAGGSNASSYTSYALGPSGKDMIPDIEQFVRIHPQTERMVVSNEQDRVQYQEDNSWYVDSNFFQMFNFPFIEGNPQSALLRKNNIVITEEVARKYFGTVDCVGKELKVNEGQLIGTFIVGGVLEKLPANSHLQFSILLTMDFLLQNEKTYTDYSGTDWHLDNFITYVQVEKSTDAVKVADKFDQVFATHIGDALKEWNVTLKTELQPIVDIHLKSNFVDDIAANNGDTQNIKLFSIIAIFILFMAWANYINLSTVQALGRAKEIGVKKIVGAVRKQLIGQFLAESFIVNFLAALAAIGVASLLLPLLSKIIGQDISLTIIYNLQFIGLFLLVIVTGTLLSGLYSAFVLTSYNPVEVLKSNYIKRRGGINMRKGLIIFQFFVSILLIAGTYLVYQQVLFMKSQDLGLDIEKVLILDGPSRILEEDQSVQHSKFQLFKTLLTKHHTITAVAGSGAIPGKGANATLEFWRPVAHDEYNQNASVVFVDANFFDTYHFEFASGEGFIERDAWIVNDVIINAVAARSFGLGSPENAIGKKMVTDFGGVDTVTITGVVKDFHWRSLKDFHSPYMFVHNQHHNSYYSIKINIVDLQASIAHIQTAYSAVFPDDPFHYYFLDDDFNKQYQADHQFANLFSAFSLLAIFIACLGLFALVSVSALMRAKEMSIRKVLGAGLLKLMVLLVWEYVMLLGIATMIAVPVIFWGRVFLLEKYPYKVETGVDLFILPGVVLFIIAICAVSYQAYMAAKVNPVKSLQ